MESIATPASSRDTDIARATSAPLFGSDIIDLPSSDHRKRITFLLVVAWVIPAAVAITESYTFARMAGRPISLALMALRESTTWLTYAAFAPLVFSFAKRFSLRPPMLPRHVLLHFCGAITVGAASALLGTVVMLSTISAADPPALRAESAGRIFASWFFGDLPAAMLSYFAVVGVAHAMTYFREAQRQREAALDLAAQLADARLAVLQGRLHPHFLYNTLNTITVLVRDGDVSRSTRMLELLGGILRRMLDGSLPQIIPFETELALLQQYLEIELVRFSDRLTVVVNVEEPALRASVPALVLQPLAENAVRHAVAQTSGLVTLRISARLIRGARAIDNVLELAVEDDGPGLAADWRDRADSRTGISATRMRIATLYGASGSLEIRSRDGGGVVSLVRVPFSSASAAPSAMPDDHKGIGDSDRMTSAG